MEFVPMAAVAALTKKVIDFLKYVQNRDWNGVVTQAIVWGAGVLVIWLVSGTAWATGITVGNFNLSDLNAESIVFVGLTLSSLSSVVLHDVPQQLDPTVKTTHQKLTRLRGSGESE